MEKTWKFIHAADMQPGSPKSFRFNPAGSENWQTARRQIVALEPEFLLIGGSYSHYGATKLRPSLSFRAKSRNLGLFPKIQIPRQARDDKFSSGSRHNENCCIGGDVHCRKVHLAEGIHFDHAPGIAMGQWGNRWPDGDASLGFFEYTVSADRMEKRFVPLAKVSTRTDGYGPGGHPLPEARDYSLAWEQ